MTFAFVDTTSPEEHAEFVRLFRVAFAHEQEMEKPSVLYIESIPNMKALTERPLKEAWAMQKANKKRDHPDRNTLLITVFGDIDTVMPALNEYYDYVGTTVYVLDPEVDAEQRWDGSCTTLMQRRKGESLESFVNSLR